MNPELREAIGYLATVSIQEDRGDHEILRDSHDELWDYRISHAYRFWRSLQLIRDWTLLHVFNIEEAPYLFPDATFGLALCMEVIEHLHYRLTKRLPFGILNFMSGLPLPLPIPNGSEAR